MECLVCREVKFVTETCMMDKVRLRYNKKEG